jgi:hypothetical protein
VLTCGSVSTTASASTCTDPRINGIELAINQPSLSEIYLLCTEVTGGTPSSGLGTAASGATVIQWTGTTWVAVPSGSLLKWDSLTCNL